MYRRNAYQPNQPGMMIGGGESSSVNAEMLKQVDVPVETMLGTLNGAISGGIIAGLVSTVVTIGSLEGQRGSLRTIAKNMTSGHLPGMLLGTTALAAVGGIVRYSRAVKHNEWSVSHYAHLERAEQQQGAFAPPVPPTYAPAQPVAYPQPAPRYTQQLDAEREAAAGAENVR